MYLGLHIKIPTSHGMWAVALDRYGPDEGRVRYFCHDKKISFFWNPIPDYQVPKTVKRKARCFIANPSLYGKRGSL